MKNSETLSLEPLKGDPLKALLNHYFVQNLYHTEIPLRDFLQQLEKNLIIQALKISNGSQKNAARLLDLKTTTLNEKIKKFGIRITKRPYIVSLVDQVPPNSPSGKSRSG